MKMYYHFFFLSFLVLSATTYGQFTWKHAGPDNIGSRTRALMYHNNKIIAGSTGGGIWYSEDNGIAWKRMEGYANAGCSPVVTTLAKKGNTLFAGTGEVAYIGSYKASNEQYDYSVDTTGYLGSVGTPGQGVYISENGGDTWSNDNATTKGVWGGGTKGYLGPFTGITKVLVHSTGRIYVGTRAGLFYSDDNLATVDTVWTKLDTTVTIGLIGPNGPLYPRFWNSKILDIEEGANGDVFVGANAELGRTGGWFWRSAANANSGAGRPLFLSTDSIKVEGVSSGVKPAIRRIELAVAPSNPGILYLAGTFTNGELSGIWRSEDGGKNWKRYAPAGNPGFTPLALGENRYNAFTLAVTPDNPDNVIVAGNAWYTYSDATGWVQTAQAANPGSGLQNYVPSSVYAIAFNPNNASEMFVGTDREIVRSLDGGKTFSRKHKGYEAALTISSASAKVDIDDIGDPNVPSDDKKETVEVLLSGTVNNGLQSNKFFNTNSASNQGFGRVNTVNWSDVQFSYIYPYAAISQQADQGIVRSVTYGENWEGMYGFPIYPAKLPGLTVNTSTPDTIPDRQDGKKEGGPLVDRKSTNGFYGPNITQFVLDEVIPDSVLTMGTDAIQKVKNYVFFCSGKYLWRIENPLGSPTGEDAKWNRITNSLVGGDEFITAITVSGDENHTVYIGTSAGKIIRVNKAHDLSSIDLTAAGTTVKRISDNNPTVMKGRWISSLAVDPNQPKRLVVTYAGYGKRQTMDSTKTVIVTEDATVATPSFTSLSTNLPNMPVYTAKFVTNPATPDQSVLFIGTEKGLYYSTDLTTFQKDLASEIGNVPVVDLDVRRYSAKMTSVLRKEFTLKKDNTLFITALGKGVYTTASLAYARSGNDEPAQELDATFAQLYPNPASQQVTVKLALQEAAEIKLFLKGIDGRAISTYNPLSLEQGETEVQIGTDKLASGMYFVEVQAKGTTSTHRQLLKLMIVK